MPPRTGRRRSVTGTAENDGNDASMAISRLKPHEAFWFEDGSIVLATDVHLYRVHKGVLARSSTVFKDMLDFPTGGRDGSGDEKKGIDHWDGLPLVKMVGDTDESVHHLLRALYDRDYYRFNEPTTLPIILSLLLLSTKYDFAAIRCEVIRHLEYHYPSGAENWYREDGIDLYTGSDDDTPDDATFQLLAVARRCNVQTILPTLFYECAIEPVDSIFEYSSGLDNGDIRRIVVGRERLSKYAYEFAVVALFPEEKCESRACSNARSIMLIAWMNFEEFDPPEFPLGACVDGLDGIGDEEDRDNICAACREKSSTDLKQFRETVWEGLPDVFDLGNWETIQNVQT